MRYLVTGGSGFIGRHLCRVLVGKGHSVVNLDVQPTDVPGRYIHGSVLDQDLVFSAATKVDCVIHLASLVGVSNVTRNPFETAQTAVGGILNIVSVCKTLNLPLIDVSTSEVYGELGHSASEKDFCIIPTDSPRWAYASAKLTAEFISLSWKHSTVVRPFNVAGPGQDQDMVIPRFIRAALAGKPLTIYGSGLQTRCFTHVLDFVEALYLISQSDIWHGEIFNVGNPRHSTNIKRLATLIIQKTGASLEQIQYIASRPEGDIEDRHPDTTKIERLVGWQPKHGLDRILDDAISAIRDDIRAKT